MMAASSPAEARLKLEREIMNAAGTCINVRYFPYPCSDGRLVLLSAELDDGTDLQVLCKLDWPIAMNGGSYDEDSIRRQFEMVSVAKH